MIFAFFFFRLRASMRMMRACGFTPCTHARMHARMHAHMQARMHARMHARTHTHTHAHAHGRHSHSTPCCAQQHLNANHVCHPVTPTLSHSQSRPRTQSPTLRRTAASSTPRIPRPAMTACTQASFCPPAESSALPPASNGYHGRLEVCAT